MRLVHDPVRHHFMKSIGSAEKFVESGVKSALSAVSVPFEELADLRYSTQRKTFGWGVSYTKWFGRVSRSMDDERDLPLQVLLTAGWGLSFLPFGMVTVGSYVTPVSAAVAASLDVWNLYTHYS